MIEQATKLDVINKLHAFSIATDRISNDKQPGSYHLIVLNIQEKTVSIKSYGKRKLDEANESYTNVERQISDGAPLQVVLVSAGPVESLRRAYPNFFLDTDAFIFQIQQIQQKV